MKYFFPTLKPFSLFLQIILMISDSVCCIYCLILLCKCTHFFVFFLSTACCTICTCSAPSSLIKRELNGYQTEISELLWAIQDIWDVSNIDKLKCQSGFPLNCKNKKPTAKVSNGKKVVFLHYMSQGRAAPFDFSSVLHLSLLSCFFHLSASYPSVFFTASVCSC